MTRSQQITKEMRLARQIQLIEGRHEEYEIFGKPAADAEQDARIHEAIDQLKKDLKADRYTDCPACNAEGIYRQWNDEGLLTSDPCSRCRGCGLIPAGKLFTGS